MGNAITKCLLAVFVLVLHLLLSSCAKPLNSSADSQALVRWPPPPDQPRFFYEATLRGNRDVELVNREQQLKILLAGDTRPKIFMSKPFDVATKDGRIYVTDTVLNLVHVFDLPRRRYFQFGFRREGTLQNPHGIAVDNGSNIYVADSQARRIYVFDSLGLYLKTIGSAQELDHPTSVTVSPDGQRIYVVDTGGIESQKHRIVVYSQAGTIEQIIGSRGRGPGEFNLPTDADVDQAGNLYVLDAGNFRVQVFDDTGKFLRLWGEVGNSFGQFARPRGIAVDRNNHVYISDSSFANVQIFNSTGQLLLPLGNKHHEDGPGHLALPAGIDTDETGRLYIVDQFYRKLEVVRPSELSPPQLSRPN